MSSSYREAAETHCLDRDLPPAGLSEQGNQARRVLRAWTLELGPGRWALITTHMLSGLGEVT